MWMKVIDSDSLHTAACPNIALWLPCTVLGRFLHALNGFVLAKYGMRHSISDYWIYEFAKACAAAVGLASCLPA